MNTFWVHKNWKWKKENATAKYIDEHCEEAVTLTDAQATVEALQASKGVVLAGDYEALAQRHRHLEQQMEALQRERDEANLYRDQARANQESLAACVDRDVRKIKDLQAALDAEREKVKGLAQQVQDQSTANLETMRHTDDMQSRALDAERALAQLQALVRAAASAPGKDWLEWQLKLGEALDAQDEKEVGE